MNVVNNLNPNPQNLAFSQISTLKMTDPLWNVADPPIEDAGMTTRKSPKSLQKDVFEPWVILKAFRNYGTSYLRVPKWQPYVYSLQHFPARNAQVLPCGGCQIYPDVINHP